VKEADATLESDAAAEVESSTSAANSSSPDGSERSVQPQGLPWWLYLLATGAAALAAVGVIFGLRAVLDDDDGEFVSGDSGQVDGAANGGDFSFLPTNDGTVGDPVPTTSYLDESGAEATLESYRGQPLVVNFWASTCAPCVAEMPDFESVFQEYTARSDLAFVGINFGDTRDAAEDMVETTGVTYDIGRDTQRKLLTDFGSTTMPTTVLVDRDGRVVEMRTGPVSREVLVTLVDQLLEL